MTRYLPDDRRRKPDGEHLEHPVRVRFNDAELQELSAEAAMTTQGRLAPLLHALIFEGLRARRERHAQLLADLAQGREVGAEGRAALADWLAASASRETRFSLEQRHVA